MKMPETCISMRCYMEHLPTLNIYWVHMLISTLLSHYSYDYRNSKLLNSSHVLSEYWVCRCKFYFIKFTYFCHVFKLLYILLYIIGDVLCSECVLLSHYLVVSYSLKCGLEHSSFISRGTFLRQ